jgi:hypothetical protein
MKERPEEAKKSLFYLAVGEALEEGPGSPTDGRTVYVFYTALASEGSGKSRSVFCM